MMKFKKLFSVVSLVFMYTNIVVTQPIPKVKVEKNKTTNEKISTVNQSNQEILLPETLKLDAVINNEIIPLNRHEIDMVNYFCKPIEFTPEGIANYFKYVYNHPEYV